MKLPFYWLKNEGSITETIDNHYSPLTPIDDFWIRILHCSVYDDARGFKYNSDTYENGAKAYVSNRWRGNYSNILESETFDSERLLNVKNWYEESRVLDFIYNHLGCLFFTVYPFDLHSMSEEEKYLQTFWPFPRFKEDSSYMEENERNKIKLDEQLSIIRRDSRERELPEYLLYVFETEMVKITEPREIGYYNTIEITIPRNLSDYDTIPFILSKGQKKTKEVKLSKMQASLLLFFAFERRNKGTNWLLKPEKHKKELLKIAKLLELTIHYTQELKLDKKPDNPQTWIWDIRNQYRKKLVSEIQRKIREQAEINGKIFCLHNVSPSRKGIYSLIKSIQYVSIHTS